MPSAPARLKAVSASITHGRSSSQPLRAGGFQHRVLAAHLIDERGRLEFVFHAPHDIEIGQAGLDHHHVRAFLEVEADFP